MFIPNPAGVCVLVTRGLWNCKLAKLALLLVGCFIVPCFVVSLSFCSKESCLESGASLQYNMVVPLCICRSPSGSQGLFLGSEEGLNSHLGRIDQCPCLSSQLCVHYQAFPHIIPVTCPKVLFITDAAY